MSSIEPGTDRARKSAGRFRSRLVRRLGLRSRIVLAFVLGSLALSTILSSIAYTLIRSSLLDRREDQAIARVAANAETVNRRLARLESLESLSVVVDNLNTPDGTEPLVRFGSEWVSPNPLGGFFTEDVNSALRVAVDNRRAATMRYRLSDLPTDPLGQGELSRVTVEDGAEALPPSLAVRSSVGRACISRMDDGDPCSMSAASDASGDNELFLVIGVPLGVPNAQYFEASSLEDVEDTLASLGLILFGAGALTTSLGMGLGWYVSRRVLRPLHEVSEAAANIASGNLSTRLDGEADRDLDQITTSFNEMATNLEEKIERDARFASEVSHELRSPLMTLTASVRVLENRREELPEKAQVAVDLLSTDITRFKQLVEDLLEISRYDVGAAALETSYVSIAEFVRQAVAFAGQPDIAIEVADGADELVVAVDKRRMGQVVRNMIENADKYAEGTTRILVRPDTSAGSVWSDVDTVDVVFEDAGPGVPMSERDAIFDRFSRGAEGGRRGSGTGVGLGLALVQEHVKLHGGEVWVADRADGRSGSWFVVRLPIVDLDEIDDEFEDWA